MPKSAAATILRQAAERGRQVREDPVFLDSEESHVVMSSIGR
jgi:hypothetical protein